MKGWLSAFFLLAACVHFPAYRPLAAPGQQQGFVIRDVRVFAATGPEALEHQDVLVERGVIVAVRPTDAQDAPGQVIDGRGLTVLPGLIDLHAHLTLTAAPPWYLTTPKPEHNAQAHVYAGVTTVLDAGGNPDEILGLKKQIAEGKLAGPRIYFAGQHLTVPGGYPLSMIHDVYGRMATWSLEGSHVRGVRSEEELLGEVDRLHGLGASFIKLMVATIPPPDAPRLPEPWVRAAVKRAHEHGMKVAAHIDTAEDALQCARDGVDLLAHGIEAPAVTEEEARTIAASGISMEPTLVNYERFDELEALHFQSSAIERESEPKELMDAFSDERLHQQRERFIGSSFQPWGDELLKYSAERPRNLYKLYKAGVPVLAGSDAMGSIGVFAGAIHDELKLQVEAGLPAAEVLLGATSRAARFLDPKARFGTVEPGKAADLLLVRGDPLQDIRATRDIVQVFIAGAPVQRNQPSRR